MGTAELTYRRDGWRAYRAEVRGFIGPTRRFVLSIVVVVTGSLAAAGMDLLFRILPTGDAWVGGVRMAGSVGFGCLGAGLGLMVATVVWWRRGRRSLPSVPWRDDRLVVDYSRPDAPDLSSALAPRLLAAAQKQRFDAVGSLTMMLPTATASALALLVLVPVFVFGAAPGVGLVGLVGMMLGGVSLLGAGRGSLDNLGRTSFVLRLARERLAADAAP